MSYGDLADSLAKISQVDNDDATDITPEKAQGRPLSSLGIGLPNQIESIA